MARIHAIRQTIDDLAKQLEHTSAKVKEHTEGRQQEILLSGVEQLTEVIEQTRSFLAQASELPSGKSG
jgi:hypothetical protein